MNDSSSNRSRAKQTPQRCGKCNKGDPVIVCDGCRQSFCNKHVSDHREEIAEQMKDIKKNHATLKQEINNQGVNETLFAQINQWEKESIEKIQSRATEARTDLKRLTDESKMRMDILMKQLSTTFKKGEKDTSFMENNIPQWKKDLESLRNDLKTSSGTELILEDLSSIRLITIKGRDKEQDNNDDSRPPSTDTSKGNLPKIDASDKSPEDNPRSTRRLEASVKKNTSLPNVSSSYPSIVFAADSSSDKDVQQLFKQLMSLSPMDKPGPMTGRCEKQTFEMERFLADTFGFRNISGKCIVQGVRSFRLKRLLTEMDRKAVIHFPDNTSGSFMMTVEEIINWQHSFRVYTVQNCTEISKRFLRTALQGQSRDGIEAFYMKFVVRVSTCPILMEFDANIIPRSLEEDWPNRIKLVSVSGIDFAGRKHDVDDILQYIPNWKDVFVVNSAGNAPALQNERDFLRKRDRPRADLSQSRLLNDLILMAKLRLRACDAERVQIVVETGIGLGVFAGEQIGIAEQVQRTSALAIRTVLEEDSQYYQNIRAVIFALPVFDGDKSEGTPNCFSEFSEQFQEPLYKGRIPVLIADQDMHRLTVAIARQGFIVSQLNPADSHGVFGEYWQNRGPAVEEKLALTTLGLLVQHHLINPHVLDEQNYHTIQCDPKTTQYDNQQLSH